MGIFNKTKTDDALNQAPAEAKAEKAVEAKVAKPAKTDKKEAATGSVFGVLLSPIVTEKSARDEQFGKYTFLVEESTTKNEIKKAIAGRYGVKPVKVNVISNEGKVKRYGRFWGKRKDTKKAVVTLPKGKSIDIYQNK